MDLTIARPPYKQIADGLRAEIESGEITDRLPTLAELRDQIKPRPAYNTVRKAINELKKEGLVETSPLGTFVKKDSRG